MPLAPDPVSLEISPEGVAVVSINRPSKRNALDELTIAELGEAFGTLAVADHIRIVILKGEGEAFCAGADIDWMRRQGEKSQAANEEDALGLARMLKALHSLPQFTLALVQGAAYGGGAGLAAAADYAVATQGAQFRFSEVRLGLTPATISPYVIEAIGARNARALFASGMPFDAAAALRFGLVQEVVADMAALEGVAKHFIGLAFENAPGAVADSKALVRFIQDDAVRTRLSPSGHLIDEHIVHETARRIAARRASDEGKEGLKAFLERRPPSWKGG
jgi:methylglutaconyl-CoA hydratase